MHLDMSGCNLGSHVVQIGEAFATSRTLQSVHLDQNEISAEVKQELYDKLRIRLGCRKTKVEIAEEMVEREVEFEEDASPRRLIANSARAAKKVDIKSHEAKLHDLKRNQLKMECT